MKPSKSDSPTPAKPSLEATQTTPELLLRIRGCGNIVSFKNSKMILPAKGNRRAMLITNPKKQKAMKSYEDALLFALCFAYQTSETGTRTGCSRASWIASSVPADDSWKDIPQSDGFKCISVPDGEEGADLYITPLTEPLSESSSASASVPPPAGQVPDHFED